MSAPIVYDTLRLFLGRMASTPRGLDRVDYGYARFFFENWPNDCVGTLPTPWGLRWYDRRHVLGALDRLEALWSETVDAGEDPALLAIKRWLSGGPAPKPDRQVRGRDRTLRKAALLLNGLATGGWSRGASVVKSAPRNAIYLNVGQVPWFTSWLHDRPDVKSVFLLHDMIPLEHPEFVAVSEQKTHVKLIDRVARSASAVVVTTTAARQSVLTELRRRGRTEIAVETVPLPVASVFLEKDPLDEELAAHAYFVVCGAIEPRKNHALLLNVWRALIDRRGSRSPKLVMVGTPGWGAEAVLSPLQRCAPLRPHVIHMRGLSSPALRRLLSHARALLMPSFAEGFGLPVIEALARGTPVVASDLPAHREVAGDLAIYRDPTDGPGWLATVCRLADGAGGTADLRRRIAGYRPLTAPEYFERIERFLGSFA